MPGRCCPSGEEEGRLACCCYTTDTIELSSNPPARAGAEGAGVEPARLIARPLSRRVPSPIGWPFRIIRSSGRCRGRTCGLQRVMLAPWPAELTARMSSTPTRTRTRDSSLEARRDPPFHHRGRERKARDSNPHPPRGGTALAGRLGQPYPTT